MVSQKNAAPEDEDVIDLTDIIEQGAASGQKADGELDSQMSDLYSKGGDVKISISPDVDSDIDDLLSQMDSGDSTPLSAEKEDSSDANRPLNPDETLDMPGMADVDALLGAMDVPPQPTWHDTPSAAAPPAQEVDLDALLDGMLDKGAPTSSTPPPAAPKLMPRPQKPAPASAGEPDLAELDALFSENREQPPSQEAAPLPPDEPSVFASIDDLLAHGPDDIVPQPDTKIPSADAVGDADAAFLLEGRNVAAPAAKPAPKPAAAPGQAPDPAAMFADLDALLGTEPAPTTRSSRTEKPLEDAPVPHLPESGTEPGAKEEEIDPEELRRAAQELFDEKVMLEASTGDVDTGAWLSALDETLNETEHSVSAAPLKTNTPSSPSEHPFADIPNEIVERLEHCEQELRSVRSQSDTYVRDLAATEARLTAMEAVEPAPTPSLDELLREGSPMYSGLVELICSAVATALSEQQAALPIPHNLEPRLLALEHQMAKLLPLSEQLTGLEGRMLALETSLEQFAAATENAAQDSEMEERLAAVEADVTAMEVVTMRLETLESRVDALPPSVQQELAERVAALEVRTETPPALDNGLEERIAALEADMTAAEVATDKLDALEAQVKTVPAAVQELAERVAALETRPEDTPAAQDMEARIAALENRPATDAAAGVEQRIAALEERPAIDSTSALEQRIATLEKHLTDASATEALEQRITGLEADLTAQAVGLEQSIDKSAAAAAARIIREEIAKLLSA